MRVHVPVASPQQASSPLMLRITHTHVWLAPAGAEDGLIWLVSRATPSEVNGPLPGRDSPRRECDLRPRLAEPCRRR